MRKARYKKGLTLIELLLALMITVIITAAVATLSSALNSANAATEDTSRKQAQVRFAALRISDLVRHCRLVCYAGPDDFAVWRADDKYNDGKINIGELVYIETGPVHDHLWICEFPSSDSTAISPNSIDSLATNWWSVYSNDINYIEVIPQCSNVQFYFDDPGSPLNIKLVSILFGVVENQLTRQYQINAALRGWAGNLLDGEGNIVSDDD
jgi:prepilin-type N-terminal cleavage/methylation domain-containing protein